MTITICAPTSDVVTHSGVVGLPLRFGSTWVVHRLAAPALDLSALLAACFLVGLRGETVAWFATAAFALLLADRPRQGRLKPSVADEVAPLVGRLAVAALVISPFAGGDIEGGRLVAAPALAVALIASARAGRYAVGRALRRRGSAMQPVIILGAGPVGAAVASTLRQRREYGLDPIGFVDRVSDDNLPLPLLGEVRDLPAVMIRHGVRRAILAFGATRESEMISALRDCEELPFDFYVVPRFFDLGTAADASAIDDVWGFPLVRLKQAAHRCASSPAKRLFDLVVASTLLVLAAPLFAAIALAVRLSSPGPILFRQKRIGQFGQPFEVLKFRTMRVNDDSDTAWSVDRDHRVTKVGRLLRPTHLDELPQLVNVLRGEMSIVGPRPERPAFADQFSTHLAHYSDRHRVRVGITGWAQVHGLWGDTSIEERARFDNRYIEHWSVWKDLVILLRTIPSLSGRRCHCGDPPEAASVVRPTTAA